MNLNNLEFKNEKWLVLKVKYKHEKMVSELLESLNYKIYNPTITVSRKWSDRIKRINLPAIPGIVFIKTSLKEKNKVFCSRSIKSWLYENNQPVTVNQNELTLLDKSLNKRNWISNDKEINLGDVIFLKHLKIDVIVNKIGMGNIWATVKNTNFTLKLDKVRI